MISLASQGKDEFLEPSYVHGSGGCCFPSSSKDVIGFKIAIAREDSCIGVSFLQLCVAIFCQSDQFPSHKLLVFTPFLIINI